MINHVFVVLGMPRGGTSVTARALKVLGIDLGDKLTPPNGEWNPKGFWEDNEIVYQVNARVLSLLNGSWESIKCFDANAMQDAKFAALKTFAGKMLLQRFSASTYWGFKDPNTAKILPFWQAVFEQSHIADHYVIALRNPLSSAQSYHQLTGVDIEHGLLIWLMHMMAAMNNTQGKNRAIVSYDLLIKEPRLQLERVKNNLSIPCEINPDELSIYENNFLDKKLRHYQDRYEDLLTHPAVSAAPLCVKMYDLLLKAATDQVNLDGNEFAWRWIRIMNEFEKLLPIYSYVDAVLQQNFTLKKSIRSLHKSRLWKVIYPLRIVDDALRARRKRLKQIKLSKLYDQ